MNGSELIAQERQRQIESEGWTPEHDDSHDHAEMVEAARAYAWVAFCEVTFLASAADFNILPHDWPTGWAAKWFKLADDPIRNLVKTGALIAAEIDRIARLREPKGDCPRCKHAWKYHVPYGEYPNGCRIVVEQDGERCHCPCKPS